MNCMVGAMRMHAPGNKTHQPVYSGAWNAFKSFDRKRRVRAFGNKHLLKSLMYFTFWNLLRSPNQRSSDPALSRHASQGSLHTTFLIKTASTIFDVRLQKTPPTAPLLVSFVTSCLCLKLLRIVRFHLGSLIPAQPAGH